ncbi:Apolipoprotein N-acyltransferase [Novipirellula aureliae]|uniref:Apolipoprotein N-acyltransferase n=1 Tax=Novipirellula aureliae TaxID=2527966 RepID=A0A5C6DIK3_9BACT|nr:apolipoprotein N-acyltransferase [Novipirellula aureliae]TWU36538.1 Apolipoprotein N-acyltransferase [Novipirellula aureliae]
MSVSETSASDPQSETRFHLRYLVGIFLVAVTFRWIAQPPLSVWPLCFVALVPLLILVELRPRYSRRDYLGFWGAATIFWLVSLQGIRHANPLMYGGWFVLSAYLAVYMPLFIALTRTLRRRRLPLLAAAPLVWVGLETIRNYFATGISAAMLGHSVADVPVMIQIADLFGTYGVSFVIATVNVALFVIASIVRPVRFAKWFGDTPGRGHVVIASAIGGGLLVATIAYGQFRLSQPSTERLATFALIQRSEPVEYQQDSAREQEIFQQYARDSITAFERTNEPIDVVVWPESMFTGGYPWMIAEPDASIPGPFEGSASEFKLAIDSFRDYFLSRNADVQNVLESVNGNHGKPHLIVGCGVIRYHEKTSIHSGIVHVGTKGNIQDWYAKNHLVMFGEYIPIVRSVPWIRDGVPDGLMVTAGEGPVPMQVGNTVVLPSICIETAVERITINQMRQLDDDGKTADVVVTVTNDGWFDDSSVIDHHRRCAQLIAVGVRRPILSAANNGPTAWIDHCGRVVDSLATGSNGAIIAAPMRENRVSLYVKIGDWPAKILALFCIIVMIDRRRQAYV